MKRLLLVVAIGWAALGAGSAQQLPARTGVIRGRVVDDTGLWVAGAEVSVDIQDGLPRMGYVMPHAETDKDGVFVVDHLAWGLYNVYANKMDGDYLNTFEYHVFYVEIPPPSAELTAKDPVAEVVVVLPRAGRVVWSATDATTGKPVSVGMKMFRWAEGDGDASRALWTATRGRCGSHPARGLCPGDGVGDDTNQTWMAAPAGVNVGLSAGADGYEVWRYPGPVRLKAGDTLTLDIKVKPVAQ
jgi:hypothetical protein